MGNYYKPNKKKFHNTKETLLNRADGATLYNFSAKSIQPGKLYLSMQKPGFPWAINIGPSVKIKHSITTFDKVAHTVQNISYI